jgi:hypothetical protein
MCSGVSIATVASGGRRQPDSVPAAREKGGRRATSELVKKGIAESSSLEGALNGSGGSNFGVNKGSPMAGGDERFFGDLGVQFECIGVEESEGEAGFVREGKNPEAGCYVSKGLN